ncbi:MAG TPA: tail fiber domain-containing protein [Polyangiales bacterium]|nr:tail fiber domain-containing protein [Polyangiales bacterium]
MASCGAKLICAASDPTQGPGGCPISRARFKQDIQYLSPEQLRSYRDQLLRMRLAAYRYKHAPEAGPQLGLIIDDVEPSAAVSGDHVNMYGYLSLAVAAIQEQQLQIDALQREIERLRGSTVDGESARCGP